jgi:RNA polymerase sigma-70 factor (ECF subfamily)
MPRRKRQKIYLGRAINELYYIEIAFQPCAGKKPGLAPMNFFPKKSTRKESSVFSESPHVSNSMFSNAISLENALAAQTQRESAEIASGLKRQDPELLDHLIELYQHRLLRYLLFLTGKREVAEDLFQETWMRVLLRGTQYNGKARFDTWLFTIARNLVIDLSRKRTMASLDEMSESREDDRPFEIAITGLSPLEQFQSREDSAEVSEVLLKLEPNYREVLVLRFYEELSLEEIARMTRAPLSTVKSRLYRGLAALKPEVESLRTSRNPVEAAG